MPPSRVQAARRKAGHLCWAPNLSQRQRRTYVRIVPAQMFPAVLSSKLEAAIAHEEGRKRKKANQAQRGEEAVAGAAKNGDRASEFEMLLNEYSKIDADEITVRFRPGWRWDESVFSHPSIPNTISTGDLPACLPACGGVIPRGGFTVVCWGVFPEGWSGTTACCTRCYTT